MAWLSPWMLLGLGALAVPVLVHLVQRETRTGRPFPSLMFLRRVPFESRRRARLRDLLLLALRAGALVALVLAFAGPVLPLSRLAAPPPTSRLDTVVLLDRSYSMSAGGRWARARDLAADRVEGALQDGRVALVAFDERAEVLAPLGRDGARVKAALARLEPARGGTRFADALDAASAVLEEGGAEARRIVLVSDLQQSALSRGGLLSLPRGTELQIEAVGGPLGGNLALLEAGLAVDDDAARERVGERLRVVVRNTGDAPLGERPLTLRVNGLLSGAPAALSLAAGEQRQLTLPLVLSADRPTRVEVRVAADAVTADDVLHAVFAPRRPIRAALAEGAVPRRHQGLFLEQALSIARSPAVSPRRVRAADLSPDLLAGVDVLILDDTPPGEGARERAVGAFVEGGGGLLVIAGPQRAGAWEAAGDRLVPGAPRGVLSPAATGLLPGDPQHPLWQMAGAGPDRLLRHVRVETLMGLAPAAGDRVLARVADNTPLLLERQLGAGRILVLGTTADPRWSSLALEPGFVPLAHSMLILLAGRRPAPASVRSGQVVDLLDHLGQLPGDSGWRAHLAGGGQVVLEHPDGSSSPLPAGSSVFRARAPGIHEAHRRDGQGPSLPVAVNPDPRESLLDGLSAEAFADRVQRRSAPPQTPEPRQVILDEAHAGRLAGWLLLLATALFAAESLLSTFLARRPLTMGAPLS